MKTILKEHYTKNKWIVFESLTSKKSYLRDNRFIGIFPDYKSAKKYTNSLFGSFLLTPLSKDDLKKLFRDWKGVDKF